jgi:hypothetical protein
MIYAKRMNVWQASSLLASRSWRMRVNCGCELCTRACIMLYMLFDSRRV